MKQVNPVLQLCVCFARSKDLIVALKEQNDSIRDAHVFYSIIFRLPGITTTINVKLSYSLHYVHWECVCCRKSDRFLRITVIAAGKHSCLCSCLQLTPYFAFVACNLLYSVVCFSVYFSYVFFRVTGWVFLIALEGD